MVVTPMHKPLNEHTFVVLDVETTGVSPFNRVCEIGMTKIVHGEIVDKFDTLINPETSITNTIFHGIKDWMVKDAPVFSEVAPSLIDFMDDSVLVAHNAPFDMRFMRYELQRLNTDLSHFALCTLRIARRLHPEYPTHRLDYMLQEYDIINEWAHRAVNDAYCSAKLFLEMKHEMQTFGIDSLKSLEKWKMPYYHKWCNVTSVKKTKRNAKTLTRDDF